MQVELFKELDKDITKEYNRVNLINKFLNVLEYEFEYKGYKFSIRTFEGVNTLIEVPDKKYVLIPEIANHCERPFKKCTGFKKVYCFKKLLSINNLFMESDIEYLDISELEFNTVISCVHTFARCKNLKDVILPKVIISKNISCMFTGCKSIKEIDLSNLVFEPEDETSAVGIFTGCDSLEILKTPIIINSHKLELINPNYIFDNCRKLRKVTTNNKKEIKNDFIFKLFKRQKLINMFYPISMHILVLKCKLKHTDNCIYKFKEAF